MQPSLGLRYSKSILQCILTTCHSFDNFEFDIFDAGVPLSHFITTVTITVVFERFNCNRLGQI